MAGKWVAPVVEEHSARIIVLPGENEPRGDVVVTVTAETYNRYRTGYRCPWCHQDLVSAFDRTCREWCCGGNRVYTEEEWHAFLDGDFEGYRWIGPSKETMERLESPVWTPVGA